MQTVGEIKKQPCNFAKNKALKKKNFERISVTTNKFSTSLTKFFFYYIFIIIIISASFIHKKREVLLSQIYNLF